MILTKRFEDEELINKPCKWLFKVLPDDCRQEEELIKIEHPNLTSSAYIELLKYRLAVLAHEVWSFRPKPKYRNNISKYHLNRRRGYIHNSSMKREARMKLPEWKRKEIAAFAHKRKK